MDQNHTAQDPIQNPAQKIDPAATGTLSDTHSTQSQNHMNADQGAAMAQRMIAPAVSMGLTWAARKAMNSAYEKRNGTEPPNASDNNVPIGKVLAWAALTAVVTTAIDTIVNRVVAKRLPENDS